MEYSKKPIQIVFSINFCKRFSSKTLRNFTLFVLPRIEADEKKCFCWIAACYSWPTSGTDNKRENVGNDGETYKIRKYRHIKGFTIIFKMYGIESCMFFFGEQNSCIGLSHLEAISFPKEYIEQIDFILTLRISSPYNYGAVSYAISVL